MSEDNVMNLSSTSDQAILDAYSEQASLYDAEANQQSCWGRMASVTVDSLSIAPGRKCVVDVGCGTGRELAQLATRVSAPTQLIGIEPALGMRLLACENTCSFPNVTVLDGRFEAIPLPDASVDHLYSIHAFHWVLQPEAAIAELQRVLAPDADLDVFFAGRGTGQEFISTTSRILRRHLGLGRWLESAKLRTQLTLEQTRDLFARGMPQRHIDVREVVETHFDTLEGHWAWWVRIGGHFASLDPAARSECFDEVRQALQSLQTDAGIPYTTHTLHVTMQP